MKRAVDIEKLLVWAYRDELAKLDFIGGESGFWTGFAELGTKVSSGGNGLQAYAAILGRGVHPDARALHEAVLALDADGQAMQPDWHAPELLLADMPPEIRAFAPDAVRNYRVKIGLLVMRCARNATRPDWRADPPVKREVRSARTGQPAWFVLETVPVYAGGVKVGEERIEADGFDRVARRPKRGAYRKTFYDPDPATIADLRADYACWHAALVALAESAGARLGEHEALPPKAPGLPWDAAAEGCQQRESRILPALRRVAA